MYRKNFGRAFNLNNTRTDQKKDGASIPKTVYCSTKLFSRLKTIVIVHNDEEYYLRITKSNKLVLTK